MKKTIDRTEQLQWVLNYDSTEVRTLTDFDRMFIHREIAGDLGKTKHPVPPHVNVKVKALLQTIYDTDWKPKL